MKTFLLVDTANCFMRALHVTPHADTWTKLGLSLHITLGGIKKMHQKFNPHHVVFCAEGRSWRKSIDSSYKANRLDAKNKMTPAEQEEMKLFFEMQNEFINYIDTKTNSTLLRDEMCEADDMISGWIKAHPNDMHIIISTDSDFIQLVNTNVQQFNPVQDFLYTVTGVFTGDGKIAKNKKGEPLPIPDPEYALFFKCIRGDVSDNVFSAYPGAREKGTKNKIGIQEAYADRIKKGFNWNSFMNHRWEHHDGTERIVKDEYAKNVTLVDLTKQPQFIQDRIAEKINEAIKKQPVPMVGVHFLRFTQQYELTTIQQYPDQYVKFLSLKYGE